MIYVLPFDLYEDWKELTLANEVAKNIVKELKERKKDGKERKGKERKEDDNT